MRARRVAALYDVHANLPALEAVLADVSRAEVDLVLFGGDLVSGPLPRETIDRLRALEGAVSIRGNADRAVAEGPNAAAGSKDPAAEMDAWCATRLSVDDLQWLGDLPEQAAVEIESLGRVLFCHGSPRSDEESLTVATPVDRMRAALDGVDADVVVCGHTHMQFEVMVDDVRVVNAGSVGLPYEGRPGAYWVLLGERVELVRTDYDIESAISEFRSTDCPHLEDFVIDPLLRPPLPSEVAAHFEQREAKKNV